ncbi:aminodeoxychorismate/anthranilate synthase component II [Testudinibacter sp. TR-2022]|uniref:aminodeoxychorismate/anthranilate synthase component II n=1 Tax=Testudinibacter sp. TR-2022 TaxID=2585029 RepID=UPI00111A982E|nr:aminodeoxychorismate/anthranilate synthase component II [Testudinibacter sp. TR-2022]TNH04467.1 aminodeoxychorismate/anthranilate synthase component II [Pasteurellaceae bacterium Phil31]TNH12011.1 aminodeoxychorismate/anthranilate synthase component II [Testudinibacter sp. TR-2022]TNH12684.1 aminodeoxychorismate/anthranilate synthase component II [Testudinibacter sp. TR-2022]TNH12799.1 aminodeoxychorismate/anthranilate synthase component II [Testudinibacter sp. TR-2022]TNH19438.1 aminodeoxy
MAKIVFIDNFDSFTYNLVDQFRVLGHQVVIYRNDSELDHLLKTALAEPDTLVALSPGPGNPAEAGNLLALIRELKGKVPMIGICLGHQAIIEAFGGKIVHAGEILHGKVSQIEHDQQAMFQNLPNPMPVARYHSLMGTEIPAEFDVNAQYGEIVMAVRHRTLPICSFQFHPESILTVQGSQLLAQSIDWLLGAQA